MLILLKSFMALCTLPIIAVESNVISYMSQQKKKIKIAVISLYDKPYESIGKYGHLNKQKYCLKHDYDFFLYTDKLDNKRKTQWSKIIAIQNHLRSYDWIFWSDADALIMNENIKLESLIDENYNIIITRDCNHINTGNFFIKNCAWSERFLKATYDPIYTTHPAWNDNWAFMQLYDKHPEFKQLIKEVKQRTMNSYLCCSTKDIDAIYQVGDFILHIVSGCHMGAAEKSKTIQEWYNKTIKQ